MRDYLFDDFVLSKTFQACRPYWVGIAGRRNWENYERIESILRKEPVFDKSHSLRTRLPRPMIFRPIRRVLGHRGPQGDPRTELGHGTNVARLETSATYLPDTQEFEIHSPSLTSTKWWIGALGKTATHGIVQAKLTLPGGKDMGPQGLTSFSFSSDQDHTLLSGVTAGDIGPKAGAGSAALDNGCARFNHVRIPRNNMFSKFAEVTEDAPWSQRDIDCWMDSRKRRVRPCLGASSPLTCREGITIAIRYTTFLRQGESNANGLERQVITYPSTYYRLLLIMSRSYVFIGLGRQTTKSFTTLGERIDERDFTYLAEIHATLCGLKVLVSTATVTDLETARRAMGGHGYSAFTGIGRLYADYLPAVTWTTSCLARDRPSASHSNYLRLLKGDSPERPVISGSAWQDSRAIMHLLEWRAALAVQNYAQTVDEPDTGVNQRLAKAITEPFVATQVGEIADLKTLPQSGARALGDLYHLYLVTVAEEALVDHFSFGLLRHAAEEADPARGLCLATKANCLRVLPNAVALTDAFSFSDWTLDSALGVFDGRVYEELWRQIQLEPLNQIDGAPGYEESLKTMLLEGRAIASRLKSRL
ncbi:peroxisomal oxidase [Melanogaster broomeanus]|nr:peroxisomal oxidase [Melanogaster broomeanus]